MHDCWNPNARPIKDFARKIACANFKSKKEHSAIFLPAVEAYDVLLAEQLGTITKNKPIHILEREKIISNHSWGKLAANGFKIASVDNELEKINNLSNKVDFAYLDFMGNLNQDVFDWSKNVLIPNLADKWKISYCFSCVLRNPSFFVRQNLIKYTENGTIGRIITSFKLNGFKHARNIALYICQIQEMFHGVDFEFVKTDEKSFYYYIGNRNPMILFTLKSKTKMSKTSSLSTVASSKATQLIQSFPEAVKNDGQFRNWKRSLTSYCNSREKETGTAAIRYRAAIKAVIAKNGGDNSVIG